MNPLVSRVMPMQIRRCWNCSEDKTEDQFYRKHGRLQNLCKPCAIAKSVEWAKKNPEKRKANYQRWAAINRERHNEQARQWTERNPDKKRESANNWIERNPEKRKRVASEYVKRNLDKANANYHKRRARIIGNGGSHSAADIEKIYQRQNKRCANPVCRADITKRRYHVDHILPLVLGGTDDPDNIQLLCQPCNNRKWAKPPEQWAKENGLLFA